MTLRPPLRKAMRRAVRAVYGDELDDLNDPPALRSAETGEKVEAADVEADPLPRCRAITKGGTRCRNAGGWHGGFCGKHWKLSKATGES